jgi:hypothetical protein
MFHANKDRYVGTFWEQLELIRYYDIFHYSNTSKNIDIVILRTASHINTDSRLLSRCHLVYI